MKLKEGDYLNSTDAEDRKMVIAAAEHVGIKTFPNEHSSPDWYCVMFDNALCGMYFDGYRTGRALNAYQFTLDLFETAGKTEVEAVQYIFSREFPIKTDDTMKTGLQEKDAVIADNDTIRGIYKLAREIGLPVWDNGSGIKAEDYLPGGERGGYSNYNIVWMRDNKGLTPFNKPDTNYNVIPASEFIARMYVQAGKEQPPQDRASVLKDRIAKLRTA